MIGIPGYTLIDKLKSTGTNILYHAVRDSDRLPVIVKMPMSAHPGVRERDDYRREYAVLQRLSEVRGVSRALGCELRGERPVLLMEGEGGAALSDTGGIPLGVEHFLGLAISLASTLTDIHRRGVIHKDLKPSNIIRLLSGETRIVDFGSATVQSVEHVEAVPAGLIEGTLAYMSPEQTGRMNRSVDYRTDLYSLGVTFYELLTGTLPFHGRDALEWFHAHMAQTPRAPHERIPAIAPCLSAIVIKLLAKVAEERYQSADGLKADLLRCQESLGRGVREPFPLGEHDIPTHFQMPQRLYGREAQVDTLLQSFERVARGGHPELVLISGYSGIGKSAVVHELYRPVVQRRGIFLDGKFDQFQRDIPYTTLAQAIRGLVRQLLAGTDAELEAWREQLHEAWEGSGQLLVDLVPQLELVVGKQPALPALTPAESQHRFDWLFQRFLGVLSTPAHPLVIFLDDLQWADMASLRLIQHLFTHPDTPPLLMIGAYRDNEVSPSHPLMLARQELHKAGAWVAELRLEPLGQEQLRQIITDALPGAEREVIEPLSALVHSKTGGNPFFFLQLMRTLNQDGLLTRTPAGHWQWNEQGIRARAYSDNVVDFLVGRLRQLPPETQQLLRLAACAGNAFPTRTLAIIADKSEDAVERELEPSLQEGLLMQAGQEQYRFLHDRIQQAAHALIPEEERKAIHLRIGRLLLASLSLEEVREKLFDVVNHLNAGTELLVIPGERHQVALLNAEAGRKAQASTAHRAAVTYFTAALSLLPDLWAREHALAFQLSFQRATSEFMSGNTDGARQFVEALRPRARTSAQLASVSVLLSNIHIATSESQLAVDCLLECLTCLGMPMPPHPSREEVEAANAEVWTLLGERPIASLLELPLMTDPDIQVVMSVLAALFTPSLFTDVNLLVLHLCRMISLSLRHGNSEAITNGYAWYGITLGDLFGRYREGHAFGELALALVERHGYTTSRARILYSMEILSVWTQPLTLSLEHIRNAFQQAVPAGDFQTAGYCCNHIITDRLALGHNLDEVHQESIARMDFARKASFQAVQQVIQHTQRYIQQLRGLSPSFDSLNGEGFDEDAFEARLSSIPHMSTAVCWYWITKTQSRVMCGRYEEACQASARAQELLWSSLGHIQRVDFHLYSALALSGRCEDAAPEARREYLEAMRRHQRQLEEWAQHNPGTFRAAERMAAAELAQHQAQWDEAVHAYDAAIQSAREHGFIQNAALANEFAARFWRKRGVKTLALASAREAREAYLAWGAHGKVKHLEDQWPLLSDTASTQDRGFDTTSIHLDALTVVKAQHAISGEIDLEQLVSTLLRVAMENVGAQRGALLRPLGNKLRLVAISSVAEGGAVVLSEDHSTHALPWSLLTYVKRTREHVLIGDASRPHPYASDDYFERGQAKAVLCLPLLRQEELVGVLYLENSLTADAFTPARITLLGHIASQAAISIENARLYADIKQAKTALRDANDELERRVDERTHELKEAQARLVEMARAAGMSEIASNVLHNVGNVLTSAVINLETTRHEVGASRVVRVRQVAGLIQEHRETLMDFLTKDSRGRRLPDYLSALAAELIKEQTHLQESLEAMNRHLEHIRAIVQVQQTYAKTPLLTEECDLMQLVDDTLRIQSSSIQRHGIILTRDFARLPQVWLDKHKVMQILVNLIANAKDAMDAMPEQQRHLLVRLTTDNGWARIQVTDSGVGLTPEILGKLFTHGFTTRKDGHGFGLHSSSLAAQMLGGRLTLESEGPGKGATATLEIPLTPEPRKFPPGAQRKEPHVGPPSPVKER
ncbi:trifunctional serine/threonine-protein kinase/ATP-binding protein/sensor histidine kinase [Stigmatella sp. ncwal1]|uniref:histidine kinase n=1 Tax=Stigmatella ashevillensis TaxID=2995309 RepID=A0ABT5D5X7_9BACT|nr:ATP-binding sensor histidine kinase [Stigmatella ashevillena]MDC0709073.1 trifunctional serine/threonine-protein kinase/ATP-binding protein/sensor histidine kinase [Stigmatella ashevillena]